MDNMAVIVTKTDINYSGLILHNKFIENGVVLKPSKKSDVSIWIPMDAIDRIIFPNAEELEGEQIIFLFEKLVEMKHTYSK